MPPNANQIAEQDPCNGHLENEQQPLIQPQNTYPRFLSSTLGYFHRFYNSIVTPRTISGVTAAQSIHPSEIPCKRLREEEKPSTVGIANRANESQEFENNDIRPQKRLKEAASTTRIVVQEATIASTSWSTGKNNTIEDGGMCDQSNDLVGETRPGFNALCSDRGETPLNCASIDNATTHKVTTLQGAHDFTVRDNANITNIGVSNVNNYGQLFALDIMERFMEKYVSLNATHDSPVQDPDRQCHPETRKGVLKRIGNWANDPDATEGIFWLHGPAGVGKSAIAQTVARSHSPQTVAATFFFYKSDPSRNDGNKLFTTIAWQLALLIPSLKAHIVNSLNERPDLPRKDIETQFQELIFKPLQALINAFSQTQLSNPVIIIDGVDECLDEKLQRRFLKIIGNAVNDPDFPLRFLICSRPEAHIQDVINSFPRAPLSLDLAKLDDANRDIEKYLRVEFSRIALEQGLDSTWPSDARIKKVVYKSSGQFIYASTLIKVIGDEYSSAITQLDIVLGLRPHNGKSLFAELDCLFKEILRRQREWDFLNDIFSILISHRYLPLSFGSLGMIMNVPVQELRIKLRSMRSLLMVDPRITFHHQSFMDFLFDSSRSGQYHVSEHSAEKRFLEIITASIVQYATTLFEESDRHNNHFCLLVDTRLSTMLSMEEMQQLLQPLAHIQAKFLRMEYSSWRRLIRCRRCNIFCIIRDFLISLTCFWEKSGYESDQSTRIVERSISQHPRVFVLLVPSLATESEQTALEKSDLDVYLYSVLSDLRETKLHFSPYSMVIDKMCSLLNFDYVQVCARVRSILDAQLLVDFVDYLTNNEEFRGQYSTTIGHRAARFALEVHERFPILPRSTFCQHDSTQHMSVSSLNSLSPGWSTNLFLARILDRNYVCRVSCTFTNGRLRMVLDNYYLPIDEWRDRNSDASSTTLWRAMLGIAKAVQYVDSMDVILSRMILLFDSKGHVKLCPERFSHPITQYPSKKIRRESIRDLGGVFYEFYFNSHLGIPWWFQSRNSGLPERPAEPEISDELWDIIERCCAVDKKSRPTLDEVVQKLESMKLE